LTLAITSDSRALAPARQDRLGQFGAHLFQCFSKKERRGDYLGKDHSGLIPHVTNEIKGIFLAIGADVS